MKNNKKSIIIIIVILVLIIISISIMVPIMKESRKEIPKGTENVISSLVSSSHTDFENKIKDKLVKEKYDLDKALIYVNPYNFSPLTGLLTFYTENEESVDVIIKGKNNNDFTIKGKKEKFHYVPIYGLYQDYENEILVKLSSGKEKLFKLKTGKLDFYPTVTVNSKKQEMLNANDIYMVTSPINMRSFGVDSYGDLRWITDTMSYHDIKVLDNGHFMIGTGRMNEYGLFTELIEMDYIGKVYKTYNIEEGYLNNFFIKKNGNIIVTSKNKDRKTMTDYIIEIDANTGKIVKTVDLFKIFESVDEVFTNELKENFFYNSGIEYYEDTDSLVLTYWGGEFVINLDYSDSKINWIFSNPNNFTNNFSKFLLKVDEGFVYPKAMHSASLNGNVLKVLDNGYNTNKEETNTKNLIGSYSSANTYKIDNGKISLVSSINEDKKLFSYALGDYEINKDNSEIALFGRELVDLDYNTGININTYDKLSSRLIEQKNNDKILDMTIDWATHSVTKVDFTKSINYEFKVGENKTTLLPSKKEEITDEVIKNIKNTTDKLNYEFGFDNKMIETNVLFMDSDSAKLILLDESNKGAIYTLKIKDKDKSEKILTDLPNGKYYVFIEENGKIYKTDKFIEIK